jgi:hypothetical protein
MHCMLSQVDEALSEEAQETSSVTDLRSQLEELQEEVRLAHEVRNSASCASCRRGGAQA